MLQSLQALSVGSTKLYCRTRGTLAFRVTCECVSLVGIQVLQIKMSQELQEEAQSKKDQVDQSFQKSCGQRTDGGT